MLIKDQISVFAPNPLIGPNADEFGVRFPDMTSVYDEDLQAIIRNKAKEQRIDLKEGIYVQLTGPSFESPAEIRMCKAIGAGASGFIIILLIVLFIYHHKRMLHRQKEQAMQANILALNAELNEKRNALRQQLHQRMDMAKHLHVEDISAKLPREVRDYLEQIVFTKEENWQELRQNFNALYGGLLEHLRTEHPLLTTQHLS